MPLPFEFDWKAPDYNAVIDYRLNAYRRLMKNPTRNSRILLNHYKTRPAQFIIDWGMTFNPQNVNTKKPQWMPFLLFPKQEEMVEWIYERWQGDEDGIGEKTREMGMSWICVSTL
jgi:phage terminase large subunit